MLEDRRLLAAQVVINEIHYHPEPKTEPVEFVELYNAGDQAADLSGWSLDGGIDFTFPDGSLLDAGQYQVVAADPQAVWDKYGVEAQGPFSGRLANEGEEVLLRESSGRVHDRVDYGNGFPWPTVGDFPGPSIQLIHPGLDNDLGGSWRSAGSASESGVVLFETEQVWQYWKGESAPPANWRALDFSDAEWASGRAPLGYGESMLGTELIDMPGNYSTLYVRHTFQVDTPDRFAKLRLEALYDDGIVVWINGKLAVQANVPGSNLPYTATASSAIENLELVPFDIPDPTRWLQPGTNVIAIQLLNSSLSGSTDAFIDARLTAVESGGEPATPGRINSVYAESAPPQLRQVAHEPQMPTSGQPVTVTVKATDPDGVSAVRLHYQLVAPGDYISLDDPRYANQWTTIVMRDDGTGGDAEAGDDVYTARLDGALQQHRWLVRYRIEALDGLGAQVVAPYADDPQPNFAYFVYDGVPSWTGAVQPGRTPPVTYSSDLLSQLPVYQLITTRKAHEDGMFIPSSTRASGYTGSDYLWYGTMVYDGVVYDHIQFRARGGVWRYAMGKNMWKFNFQPGHRFQAKDNYGRPYATQWDKLNFSAIIQQGDYLHRGEQGLFESVGFQLFNLAGVEAPNTHFVHFRIIDQEAEQSGSQYDGDFQGLYLAIEQPDGRMLDEHGLPDGNFYKMEGGTGTLNNQGPTQPTDRSDLDAFQAAYSGSLQTEQWWRDNLDLERYYSYRAIVEAIHHYDIGSGKNYFYYHNPETGKWQVHPWDIDLTWADNMFGNGEEPFASRVARRTPFSQEYRNRLREILDLLYNPEQTGWLIDQMASLIYTPGEPSWVDADRAMWDYNPILSSSYVLSQKAGRGRFYRASGGSFAGMIDLMKEYVQERGEWIDRNLLIDRRMIPTTPTIVYNGPEGYPVNQLVFQSSPFQGLPSSFGAVQWRVAEVWGPGIEGYDPSQPPRFEIQAAWESGPLAEPNWSVQVPSAGLHVGSTYRARVRVADAQGRWSHWSEPVQFVAGAPEAGALSGLRISEIYYHPTNPLPSELALVPGVEDEDFEYLELTHTGVEPVELQGVRIAGGIEFTVDQPTLLQPGQSVVVVRREAAFRARFGGAAQVIGEFSDGRLSNSGDTLQVIDADNQLLFELTYGDADGWPTEADGDGAALHLRHPGAPPDEGSSWEAAAPSPGQTNWAAVAQVAGHHLFYNGSRWDGFDPAVNAQDDQAVAPDKQALLPGQSAGQENVTAHPGGITGLMVDIHSLAESGLSLSDFRIRILAPGGGDWIAGPAPINDLAASVRRGDGIGGSDRLTLVWEPGTIVDTWLEVTVRATAATGLAEDHVFYVGSLVGDVAGVTPLVVDKEDWKAQSGSFRSFLDPAAVDDAFDLNRDGLVDGSDLAVVRDRAAMGAALPDPLPQAPPRRSGFASRRPAACFWLP